MSTYNISICGGKENYFSGLNYNRCGGGHMSVPFVFLTFENVRPSSNSEQHITTAADNILTSFSQR